ncbi:prion-like-(Q/N-rich) domain-bearing protein 25 [Amphibalanus amphitrite]|uniref:prion-like-(Q/N-rich) domain-bearing protein 25 n=1 Tax=Amphibalanus amphitrite TaxID=1232801 RepID=UPI001C91B382|nr:prion-like-(Q/N-rich) domain-bearing protein 25 [Amphibalanus amphitrite]
MKTFTALVVALAACSLAAAKETAAKEATEKGEEGSSRQSRLFFLSKLLAGPAALAGAGVSSLGQSLSSFGSSLGGYGEEEKVQVPVQVPVVVAAPPTTPNVIYVAKQQKPHKPHKVQRICPVPLFTRGCPAGHVCAVSAGGQTHCEAQYPEGVTCQTGYQCTSGVCRRGTCAKDDCDATGGLERCPAGQECVATKVGYRCHAKSKRDLCPMLLEQIGCPENQYCGSGPDGNICKPKLQVGDTCTVKTQCLSDTCRNRKCKADACPTIDMSIDCMSTQYCSPGEHGHICVAKKDKGSPCSSRLQCKSNVCDDRGVCIEDKCPHAYMEERCLPTQFCSPAPYGNVCMDKRKNNEQCHQNAECKSGLCRNGVCKANECPTPFSSEGCNQLTQFCMTTANGNECVTKLANQQPCITSAQCLLGNCVNGLCSAAGAGTQLANGAACSMPTECASGNCVLQRCAATRNGISGVCMDNDDCQSNNCVMNVCAVPVVTPTVAPGVTTTAATTLAPTTLTPQGGMCTTNEMCASMRCINMQCAAPLLELGITCTANSDCQSNNCAGTPMVCTLGTVATLMPCVFDSQCASAACGTVTPNICV